MLNPCSYVTANDGWNESSMLVALVGGVEQIGIDDVCRDTDDAQVAQDKRQ